MFRNHPDDLIFQVLFSSQIFNNALSYHDDLPVILLIFLYAVLLYEPKMNHI